MVDEDVIEHLCRTICMAKNIDPDGTGYAVTPDTKKRLGDTFKLWEFQIPVAEAIYSEFGLG